MFKAELGQRNTVLSFIYISIYIYKATMFVHIYIYIYIYIYSVGVRAISAYNLWVSVVIKKFMCRNIQYHLLKSNCTRENVYSCQCITEDYSVPFTVSYKEWKNSPLCKSCLRLFKEQPIRIECSRNLGK